MKIAAMIDPTNSTRKIKNSNCAIPADALAMPPKPNTPAIIATMKKVIAQPNIVNLLSGCSAQ